MRTMTLTSFCAVCQENTWLQFMARVDFIDDVVVSGKRVRVKPIPLGQLRSLTDNLLRLNANLASPERYIVR